MFSKYANSDMIERDYHFVEAQGNQRTNKMCSVFITSDTLTNVCTCKGARMISGQGANIEFLENVPTKRSEEMN